MSMVYDVTDNITCPHSEVSPIPLYLGAYLDTKYHNTSHIISHRHCHYFLATLTFNVLPTSSGI